MRPDLTIVAVADTHVDDRITLAGISPVDPETGEPLVLAQARRMMQWVGEVAREADADLVVHAGDLYERPRPSPASEAVAAEALAGWCAVAPVLLLLGNHDRPNGAGAHALEPLKSLRPGRLRILDEPAPFVEHLERSGAVGIYPVPYPSRSYLAVDSDSAEHTNASMSAALDQVLAAHATSSDLQPFPTILLGHGTLRGARYNAYQTVPLSDLQVSTDTFGAFDLGIWGHLHQRQRAPGCAWSGDEAAFTHGYVGSPDLHDFGEEGEAKGLSVFRLVDGRWSCEFVPYPHARTFWTLTAEFFLEEIDQELFAIGKERQYVIRVAGDVDEATFERVARKVRVMKGVGFLIANRCAVIRPDRARVADVRADLGADGVLDAVFVARPDLGPRADLIRANVRELIGGAA